VWYLDAQKSVCPGCARGCNIEVHFNRRRPHHAQGRRLARLKPRFNEAVNRWWICDDGRYGSGFVDDESRLVAPTRRDGDKALEVSWADMIALTAAALRRYRGDEIGVIASPRMSNEDLFLLTRVVDALGVSAIDYRVPPARPGDEDDILIRADRNPNTLGADLIGLGRWDARAILGALRERRLKCVWIFSHDLFASAWPEGEVLDALLAAETVIFQGVNANAVSAHAHLVLPAAAYPEREGTYTNFEGRVQRFRQAFPPLGHALPDWEILGRVLQALAEAERPARAEDCFRDLAAAVPAFTGMSYRSVGDAGQPITRPRPT
jgi:NADH-quinone oxidoreductase subunit G